MAIPKVHYWPHGDTQERLLSTSEVMSILGVCEKTVKRMRASGKLAFIRVGRVMRYRPSEIDRYLEENTKALSEQRRHPAP